MTGRDLRAIRQRLGLSHAAMARVLGYTGNHATVERMIRRYEGRRDPLHFEVTEAECRSEAITMGYSINAVVSPLTDDGESAHTVRTSSGISPPGSPARRRSRGA